LRGSIFFDPIYYRKLLESINMPFCPLIKAIATLASLRFCLTMTYSKFNKALSVPFLLLFYCNKNPEGEIKKKKDPGELHWFCFIFLNLRKSFVSQSVHKLQEHLKLGSWQSVGTGFPHY
jgi:hypothetical protein